MDRTKEIEAINLNIFQSPFKISRKAIRNRDKDLLSNIKNGTVERKDIAWNNFITQPCNSNYFIMSPERSKQSRKMTRKALKSEAKRLSKIVASTWENLVYEISKKKLIQSPYIINHRRNVACTSTKRELNALDIAENTVKLKESLSVC